MLVFLQPLKFTFLFIELAVSGGGGGEEEKDRRKEGGGKIEMEGKREERKRGREEGEGGKRERRQKTEYTAVTQPSTPSSLPPSLSQHTPHLCLQMQASSLLHILHLTTSCPQLFLRDFQSLL